ncbi:MAG: B12-binding domain-containing radical SAM protein [Promethearchaeota archaeon]
MTIKNNQSDNTKTRVLLLSMPDTFMGFSLAAKLPNIGLVSLAANCDSDECVVGVADLVLRRYRVMAALKNLLDRFKPHIVGLNAMTFQWYSARRIAKWIKEEYNPNIKIILGGYHATTCYEEIGQNIEGAETADENNYMAMRSCPWCDFIVRGEGEETFKQFIHEFNGNQSFSKIKGLSWRDEEGVMHHNERRACLDLSKIKLPDRNARLIKKTYHTAGKIADCVETSRGCPNSCKFCSIREMYGRNAGIRYYSLDRVIEDIKECQKQGAQAIVFIDDNITADPERLEDICDLIIQEKKKGNINKHMEFHTQASAYGLLARDSLIPKMGKAGFSVVFFGIENISKRNLKTFRKSIPAAEKVKTLVSKLHKNNMISFGGFILGNPEDSIEDFERNFQYAKYLDLDVPAFQILTPFPKTELREELIQKGYVTNQYNYFRYHGLYSNVKTKYLDPNVMEHEILRLYYKYYRPSWMLKRLNRVTIIKRYYRYMALIFKKYYKLAFSTWYKEYMMKKYGLPEKKAENGVLKKFEFFRDVRLRDLFKK